MKRGFDRTERVADLIQKTLANYLIQGMEDERFRLEKEIDGEEEIVNNEPQIEKSKKSSKTAKKELQ